MRRVGLVAGLVLVLAWPAGTGALPRAHAAALSLSVTADPNAPRGVEPKLTFVLSGVTSGREYSLNWDLVGTRRSTACTAIGTAIEESSAPGMVLLGPAPDGDYGTSFYRPFCAGRTYSADIYDGGVSPIARLSFRAPGVAAGEASLTGSLTDDIGMAVPDAYAWLCPAGAVGRAGCQVKSVDTDGRFSFTGLGAGSYTLQATPPNGAADTRYFESAPVTVALRAGENATRDITLPRAVTIPSGVTVDGPSGQETSGVATVEDQPSSIEVPVDAEAEGPPNSRELVGAALSLTAPGGLNIADGAMFELRYGSDGKPAAVSELIEGPGQVSSAPQFLNGCSHPTFSMSATDAGGAQFSFDDGSDLPLSFHFNPIVLPSPEPTQYGSLDVIANGLINVANSGLELIPGVGEYNSSVYGLNVAAYAVNGDYGLALSSAVFNFGLPSLAEHTGIPDTPAVGPARFTAWEFSAGVAETSVDQLLPDPSATSPCRSRTLASDLYIDPSGRVLSTSGAALGGARVTIKRSNARRGKFVKVPNGSPLLSPANRHDPAQTGRFGDFGWDVMPGFYRITAAHAGCRSSTGGASTSTGVLRIPPPMSNLVLRLRCPHLDLARSHIVLRVSRPNLASSSGSHSGLVLSATVHAARGRRTPVGTVTFLVGRRRLGVLALDRSGRATMTRGAVPSGRLGAIYSGDDALWGSSTRG